jgi:class 3 adenylate cyclase
MELRDERKVVTALFADLVGSTALGERLDPEELRLVVGDAVGRIVAEVEWLGGRVKGRFPTGRSVSFCATGSGSARTSPSCVPG